MLMTSLKIARFFLKKSKSICAYSLHSPTHTGKEKKKERKCEISLGARKHHETIVCKRGNNFRLSWILIILKFSVSDYQLLQENDLIMLIWKNERLQQHRSREEHDHTYDARLAMVIACDITCSAEQGGHAKKLLAISSHRLHLLSIIFLCHSPLLQSTGTSIFAAERNTGVAFQIKAPTSFYCQLRGARNISTKLSDDKHQVLTYSRRHL